MNQSKKRKQEQNTITNIAWEDLFERYNIIENVKENGFFRIKAKEIKEVREPRLMAKFDHKRNLPYIFKENDLSIMPISRSEYVIGEFNVFQKVKYNIKSPQIVDTPSHLTTIDPTNLYFESLSFNCATYLHIINN